MKDKPESKIKEILQSITNEELLIGVMSSPWQKTAEGILRISIRPVVIQGRSLYQVTDHYQKKVMHRNLSVEECSRVIEEGIPVQFQQGIFTTTSAAYHVLVNKKHQLTVMKKEGLQPKKLDLAHNRTKNYRLKEGVPTPFLIALGIMTDHGKVIAKKYDKFRQINRFVEMVSDIISYLPSDRPVRVVDFGCGKASLTFALYDYLHNVEGREVVMIGLDLKKEVIEDCQRLADQLEYSSLKFEVGDINHHQPDGKIDLVISLHACDTATDAALEKAVQWGAEVILCVPCCQHELYGQIQNDSMATLLRHGILRERFAALATDAARAELLTVLGYDVQVLEFIDMEHTPKNLLLRAVKDPSPPRQKVAQERYQKFKAALHIFPSLEQRSEGKIH